MKQLTKCEICGSEDIQFAFKGKDKLFGVAGEFTCNTCKSCNTYFINPQPSIKEMNKYYPKEYYSLKDIDTSSKKVKLKLMLYETFYNDDPDDFLFQGLMKAILFPFKFLIMGTIIKPNIKLLDIGCGSGQFLWEMKQFGLDVYGVEPGDFNIKETEKYKLWIAHNDLLSAKYQKKSFDLITLNNVLEHIYNPNEIIEEIHRILKNNGTLIIDIPNTNSLSKRLFGVNWLAWDVPRHLFSYNKKNVKILLKNHGFIVTKIRHNSRPSQFVVSLYFLFGKKLTSTNRLLEAFFTPLTWVVNTFKLGDNIELQCIKEQK